MPVAAANASLTGGGLSFSVAVPVAPACPAIAIRYVWPACAKNPSWLPGAQLPESTAIRISDDSDVPVKTPSAD
jgi:hypothetical protein